VAVPPLLPLLQEAVQRFGSQAAAAAQIGVDPTRFGRVLLQLQTFEENPRYEVSGELLPGTSTWTSGPLKRAAPPSFEVATCLRLARALGRSPLEVLRAGGKSEEADLIEDVYGAAQNFVLTPVERKFVERMRHGPKDQMDVGSAITDYGEIIKIFTNKLNEQLAAVDFRFRIDVEAKFDLAGEPAEQVRQGDILLTRTMLKPSVPAKPLQEGRLVLAYGEQSGHMHQIVGERDEAAPPPAALHGEPDGTVILHVAAASVLRHEIHDPIHLEPGNYVVRQQQTYSPASGNQDTRTFLGQKHQHRSAKATPSKRRRR
jgi:hypothetical protein